jgi:hypothetical protein
VLCQPANPMRLSLFQHSARGQTCINCTIGTFLLHCSTRQPHRGAVGGPAIATGASDTQHRVHTAGLPITIRRNAAAVELHPAAGQRAAHPHLWPVEACEPCQEVRFG